GEQAEAAAPPAPDGDTPHTAEHATLPDLLVEEMHGQAAWVLFFKSSIAERLRLNPTDHNCLDMIWKCYDSTAGSDCMTPGQLARETKLTTGAVTGILDRLEQAGYVVREHDPEDRRRIIVRPVPERIKAEVRPMADWLSKEFTSLCSQYSDEELRKMVEF